MCDHSNESYRLALFFSFLFFLSTLYRLSFCLIPTLKFEDVTIQTNTIEQAFHVALFILRYKAVPTFKSLDQILVCDHSNESY